MGNFEADLIDHIRREISRIFGFAVETQSFLSGLTFAFDPERNQYHSTAILERLDNEAPGHVAKILAVTEVDLFIPILTYVYGEAQLGGRACIISTHRLREGLSPINTESKFLERLTKEAVHELGHTFKLRHCTDHACIMHYCRSITDVDHKSDQLCRYCRILLDDEIKRMDKR